MDLEVKSRKVKRERDTLQRKEGGVFHGSENRIPWENWGVV